jgi:hypothetical protein
MVGYVVVLAAVIAWGHLDGTSPWRFVWAVLPVLPTLLVVRASVRHVRRLDEYQRRVMLEGLAVGFALAMVCALTVGMLGVAGLALPMAGWIIYGVGMLGWAIAGGIADRR